MYGGAGRLLAAALDGQRGQVPIAGKIWTPSAQEGAAQLGRAVAWYGGRAGLMQIHNLLSWPAHLTMLEVARDGWLRRLHIWSRRSQRFGPDEMAPCKRGLGRGDGYAVVAGRWIRRRPPGW